MIRNGQDKGQAGGAGGAAGRERAANVAFYVRVSTDKQANREDGSLDTQLDRLSSFVEYRRKQGENWTVTEKIVEGEGRDGRRRGMSGKSGADRREGLRRLLELARARLVDVVVVTKIDRISRSVVDFLSLVKELDGLGVKLVSLRENIDLTTPSGKFQTTLLIALAEHERETISARTKEKTEWRAEKGLPIGPPPIGYRMKDKMYVIDDAYVQHVRDCERIYLEHESANVVVREFDRLGYRTPRGNRYNLPLVCHMLRNPVYAGRLAYEGKVHDAQWKAIRDLETHERIQRLMDANKRRNGSAKRPTQYTHLLQGLLRCGVCERHMTPRPGTGANGRPYHYYACTMAEKSLGTACSRKGYPADVIDHALVEYLKRLVMQPEVLRRYAAKANASTGETVDKLQADLARVREQLAAVRTKLGRMVDAVGEGGKAAMATLGEKMAALESEREELETAEARLKAEIEATVCQNVSVQDQVRTLALFKELAELNTDQPQRLKALLPSFLNYVIWREEDGVGSLEIALFPVPYPRADDTAFRAAVAELAASTKCGARRAWVLPRLGDGVPDGI